MTLTLNMQHVASVTRGLKIKTKDIRSVGSWETSILQLINNKWTTTICPSGQIHVHPFYDLLNFNF